MSIPLKQIPAFGAGQVIIDGALGRGWAHFVGQPCAEEDGTANQMGKVFAINVTQLGKPPVLPRPVRVKPAGVVAQALIGNQVCPQLPHQPIVAQEGV